MLASIKEHFSHSAAAGMAPPRERSYSGFPWWHALLVEANREEVAAQWLMRVRVFVYLPTFMVKVRRRGHRHFHKLRAAIPGLLFVPEDMIEQWHRDDVLHYAPIYGFVHAANALPARLTKGDIELVRTLEARLNLPPEAKGVFFKLRQEVRFKDGSPWQSWLGGVIFDIVDEDRIGVLVPKLFGCPRKVYVPASEIEAM